MKRSTLWVAVALAVAPVPTAGAATLVALEHPRPDAVAFAGFEIDKGQDVNITFRGYGYRSAGQRLLLADAWILDSSSREMVWDWADANQEWKESRVTEASYKVDLPKGTYEVYLSTFPEQRRRDWSDSFLRQLFSTGKKDVVSKLMDKEDVDDVEGLYDRFGVRVEGSGRALDEKAVEAVHDRIAAKAIVSIRRLGDHAYVQRGFELERPMKVHIYAVGEARQDGLYDYGWITNADTGEKVWRFTYDDSYHAGGAMKNRVIDSTFEAPAGKYVAVYGTDDSHSWERWNAAPPFDPSFWGMTIRAEDPANARYARTYQYKEKEPENIVVEMIRVGDDELVKKGFTLTRPMSLRIYALGEGMDGDMYDYGWIIDAATRHRVWQMRYADTEHAGGGQKNRMVDDVVHFDKGSYVVYYATDDSHSYPHWNTAPPMDRERWGITITGAEGYQASAVRPYDDDAQGNYLVRLLEMGDDEHASKEFTLKKKTRLQVVAEGEGVDGKMYDYGWIEDAKSGRVVWEMTYRKTTHAGGADKNRLFDDVVVLDPGTYKAYYESDGSHSFGHWNAERPYDPENWGIAIRVAPAR